MPTRFPRRSKRRTGLYGARSLRPGAVLLRERGDPFSELKSALIHWWFRTPGDSLPSMTKSASDAVDDERKTLQSFAPAVQAIERNENGVSAGDCLCFEVAAVRPRLDSHVESPPACSRQNSIRFPCYSTEIPCSGEIIPCSRFKMR